MRHSLSGLPIVALALTLALALAACIPARGGGASDSAAPARPSGVSAAETSAAAPQTQPGSPRWVPPPIVSWQWQLSGVLDPDVDAEVFDLDFETTGSAEIDRLKRDGRRSICYFSAGSREPFRGDADKFPESVRGNTMTGWADEQWLDIRRMDVLLPVMASRMDMCVAKGFDAVEPDNVDGYVNTTGFPLTAEHQLAYNRAVAELAHARGLSVALKNDVDQIPELVHYFDFAVNEECFRYGECDRYRPFTDAGKAVLHVEYEGALDFCAESKLRRLSSMLKPVDLGAARQAC